MILMTKAKDWIDKRTDGVVAKAFNLSYCIRIGMCKKNKFGAAAEMHQREVRAQHGGNNSAQSNGRASTTVFHMHAYMRFIMYACKYIHEPCLADRGGGATGHAMPQHCAALRLRGGLVCRCRRGHV